MFSLHLRALEPIPAVSGREAGFQTFINNFVFMIRRWNIMIINILEKWSIPFLATVNETKEKTNCEYVYLTSNIENQRRYV